MKLVNLVSSLVVLGAACTQSPDSAREEARTRPEIDRPGMSVTLSGRDGPQSMRSDPRGPRDAGPAPNGRACGPNLCGAGEFCCSESCGLCLARGTLCPHRECGSATAPAVRCVVDLDCRAASSYCEGCQCLAVAASDPDPSCHAPPVSCLVDPCHDKHAVCIDSVCTLADG